MKRSFQYINHPAWRYTSLFAVLLIASCHSGTPEKTPVKEEAKKLSLMSLYLHPVTGKVRLPATLQPYEQVQIFPRVNGFIKSVLVDRGTTVNKGQLLVSLEAPEIMQQAAAAKLRYTQAEANWLMSKEKYDRLVATNKTPGTISAFDLSSARTKMAGDSAMAQGELAGYRAAAEMMNYLNISAPFAGVITERNMHPGALVGPGAANAKPMLVLQQLSKLRLTMEVPEQYAGQVKAGDTIHYKINALPGVTKQAVISRSSQSLNNMYRAETIEADVENPGGSLKPGMYAEVELSVSGNLNAFIVPNSAIVTTTERKYVVLVNMNIAKWEDVKIGNVGQDSTEVFGNFRAGDQIVANADYGIKNGDAVK